MDLQSEYNSTAHVQADFAALMAKLEQLPAKTLARLAPELERLRSSVAGQNCENEPGYRALEESAHIALAK